MKKRLTALFLVAFALTSCANSKPAAEKVDPCREVMRITGKMNDQLMKALENDNYTIASSDTHGNVLELMELQSKIDDEAQKIYIGKLIEDFTKMENPETYSEGTMSLVADLQLDKLRIVCPS